MKDCLTSRAADFQTATVVLYGKEETVQFLCLDLLWGQGLYQELRFVLVVCKGHCSILVSTDPTLAATDIIHIYSYRFRIECTFREMKQVIGAFSYRFWSKFHAEAESVLEKGRSPSAGTSERRTRSTSDWLDPSGDRRIRHVPMHRHRAPATNRFTIPVVSLLYSFVICEHLLMPLHRRPRLPIINASLFFACLLKTGIYP
ncbi:hypothetical protein RB620_29495 [Paenibacillus sp. LHD-117]|uniref:hypothetical protein n=1 Tax=Paenibacillus sp. LHD-117 TaxID=3071412 RepID=UPI0027DFA49B|nr:hypothetical protein [Paenibacillus sp. LHD-117]MDQ6423551.1 hypothetical protein [Paenibacillus sp. LHD-117]